MTYDRIGTEMDLEAWLAFRRRAVEELLSNIHERMDDLEALLEEVTGHWAEEDAVYRFYHTSFKVFRLQQRTEAIVQLLWALRPTGVPGLNPRFVDLIDDGTGRRFRRGRAVWIHDEGRWDLAAPDSDAGGGTNERWTEETRPILEAFWHAKYMLAQAVAYGHALDEPPDSLPSGWAALLYLYHLR